MGDRQTQASAGYLFFLSSKMASAGNPNQTGGAFDIHMLFKPANAPPNAPIPSSYPAPPPPYPTPTGPFSYPPQTPPSLHHYLHYPHDLPRPVSVSFAAPSPQISPLNPNPGARLMALLSPNATANLEPPPPGPLPPAASAGAAAMLASAPPQPAPLRLPSSKLPKGRHLVGDRVVYDIDDRLPGEAQPQLEVTPITKYVSDPSLVLGRQIAVNRTYICYGLKLGAIRVLNINTALRSLLKGHTQRNGKELHMDTLSKYDGLAHLRKLKLAPDSVANANGGAGASYGRCRVTDMAFFAEDVHLLASSSIDGRIFVWKINEGPVCPDEEDKPQITGKAIVAIQIVGDGEAFRPREILVVSIGNRVLKIDTTKVGRGGESFSAEQPVKCPIEKLIDGVQLIGTHEGEVTDLSMSQWMTTRLVSASIDGVVKIWEDRKASPLVTLRPHDGQPVNSVTFLTAPHRPDHIVLITGGYLNKEIKVWASAGEEGWLLPSDSESWQCIQALELKSSAEPQSEEGFFNQVVVLPASGLILLANAKKNAIYAAHVEYGPYPKAVRMDYIAEFTVTMPILSLTGTSDWLSDGEHVVQVYCVQTQAIQQYALDLSQCLPPPLENAGIEKESGMPIISEAPSVEGATTLGTSSGLVPSEVPGASATSKQPVAVSSSQSLTVPRYPVLSGSSELPSHELTASTAEPNSSPLPAATTNISNISIAPPPLPQSPRLSRRLSGFRSTSDNFDPASLLGDHGADPAILDYSVDRRMDVGNLNLPDVPSLDENSKVKIGQNDVSMVSNSAIAFQHPTHLITPEEILSTAVSSSENTLVSQVSEGVETKVQDVSVNNDVESIEVEVKEVGETGLSLQHGFDHSQREQHVIHTEKKEQSFYTQSSDLGSQMARECCSLPSETPCFDEVHRVEDIGIAQSLDQPLNDVEEVSLNLTKDAARKDTELSTATVPDQSSSSASKGRKQKGKSSQVASASSPAPSPFNSTDSLNETGGNAGGVPTEVAFTQILAIQDKLSQLMAVQKEIQKQMTSMVSGPVNKEGKRIEAALGRSMEKALKSNSDALWSRIQEEHAKQKLERDRIQQTTSLISNSVNKELPAIFEKSLKKEIAAIGPAVARAITPILEKNVSSAIADSFQKWIGDKAVNQLEKSVNSKLEATVARQIQAQFQTSGKQTLQDALRSSLEASVIPAFEQACRAMFEQVDAAFQKGMVEHASAAQQQFESTHSPLALALRDAMGSASSLTKTLSGELADGQRNLLAFMAAGANQKVMNPMAAQQSNGPLGGIHEMPITLQQVEAPIDPKKELQRLISEHKYGEAFTLALQRSDVSIVSWLCSQVDLQRILSMVPIPLSQGVMLSLLQQLACDIGNETSRKLEWMRDVLVAIDPVDPTIVVHVRPIFEQVYQILGCQRGLPTITAADTNSIRLIMHVINSSNAPPLICAVARVSDMHAEHPALVLWIFKLSSPIIHCFLHKRTGRDRDDGIEAWITQVRRLVFRAEDAVDEFMIQTHNYRLLFPASFLKRAMARHRFGTEMQIIRRQVKNIDERRRRYEFQQALPNPQQSASYGGQSDLGAADSEPWVEETDIVGLDKDALKLPQWLLEADGETQERAIVSIVGAGGSGKTTLARKAYKGPIQIHFECHAWVSVSQTFWTKDILRKMLKGFFESRKEAPPIRTEAMEEAELRRIVRDYLQGKRYALVLDDIWHAHAWQDVKHALPREGGGRIIFTTRIENIAFPVDERCRILKLEPLSDGLAWELFCTKAFRNQSPRGACPKHLVRAAEAMVKKCKGLPLALVAMGGLMSKKAPNPSEWNEVLENLQWELTHNEDLATLNRVLLTSYNYLPSHLKYCFLYCAMFPEDDVIERKKLIRMWVAEGFVEEHPQKTFEEAANDCFLQLMERNLLLPLWPHIYWRPEYFQLHDLMRDVAVYMFKKEEFATLVTNQGKDIDQKQHRRLAIQSNVVDIPRSSVPLNPRTCLVFCRDDVFLPILYRTILDFTLLRVLNLEGSKMVNLPKEIGKLIHLRYLNLSRTRIERLPKSLQRLHNLQTLDVRHCHVKSLPHFMIKLVRLRHLLVGSYSAYLEMPRGISELRSLQTLEGALVDDELSRELGDLKQVRELRVGKVRGKHCKPLCNSISQLQHLRCLCVETFGADERLQLQSLQQPPPYLEELRLSGIMESFPQWIGALSCVREIKLRETRLVDDPFPTLGLLPNLQILDLNNAYVGKQISFASGGFPRLRSLEIMEMLGLEELSRIGEGTLQSLQVSTIDSCPLLKTLPDGLQDIASMKVLLLYGMPEEFIDRIRKGGDDHFKVEEIPLMRHTYSGYDSIHAVIHSLIYDHFN
ncbi:hypothetical protein ACLOJK_015395 [Asimina triloba]